MHLYMHFAIFTLLILTIRVGWRPLYLETRISEEKGPHPKLSASVPKGQLTKLPRAAEKGEQGLGFRV